MEIGGTVERIIFRSPDSGYTVAEIKANGRLVVAVGSFPFVSEGEEVLLKGEYKTNQKFGEQFNVDEAKIFMPATSDAVLKYLSSGLFKGIGPVTAFSIVEKFKDDTLKIIEFEPYKLARVKGISAKKAADISESFKRLKSMQSKILFLQSIGISINLAVKIYKVYEEKTEDLIRENPYRLVEDVDGIGFATADKIAAEIGIEKDGAFRIRAAVLYVLKTAAAAQGHNYLPLNVLVDDTSKLLKVEQNSLDALIKDVLDGMIITDVLKTYELDGITAVMLTVNYATEKNIAGILVRQNAGTPDFSDVADDIAEFERINGVTLHENQKSAIENSVKNGVSVITGGPGTGKTTIVKAIIFILKNRGGSFVLAAPTGRAAKRLSAATGADASTIHRLLEIDVKSGGAKFVYNEYNKLEYGTVIIDEMSMVDMYIFNALLKAMRLGTRLIMVGDKDQLPSVGSGNVLSDIIESRLFSVNYLTYIYRQESESLIISNAHRINRGIMPVTDVKNKDFFFMERGGQDEILDTVVDLMINRLPKYFGVNGKDIQILSPMKKGLAGVENLNAKIQSIINPPPKDGKEILTGETKIRAGDKVMQTANNYQLEWIKYYPDGSFTAGDGVYNGDIGFVESVDPDTNSLRVRFEDDKTAVYSSAELSELVLAYAVSVHKSQGSEFDYLILVAGGGNYMIMTRNLLYTAVTRAKKGIVIVGSKENLRRMTENTYTTKRNSLLKEFIIDAARVNPEDKN
ncbi:MAG: ATP-dependent RecD-like DNA helicase [Clostridiales bacterium]|jgi:exodeoxyribonuclease V alpha subunit|nr:ATP-dependent RecD-like DNA helicase [Clostridiales bacterium]MDR2090964.1 ATP-dependent RecD-like DNA helicase [Clostridiales bacterium]